MPRFTVEECRHAQKREAQGWSWCPDCWWLDPGEITPFKIVFPASVWDDVFDLMNREGNDEVLQAIFPALLELARLGADAEGVEPYDGS